jgi:outer membrane immunogenic protein
MGDTNAGGWKGLAFFWSHLFCPSDFRRGDPAGDEQEEWAVALRSRNNKRRLVMMRRVLISATSIAVLALAAQAASAADLPRRSEMPVKAPIIAPYYNWTGFYVGINGGGAWGRSSFDFFGASTGNFNTSGGLVGGTAGYNYQMGQFVLGVEGDIDWANVKGSAPCVIGVFSCQTQNDWLGTARVRAGYAIDRIMPYVTGGLAVGDIKANTLIGSQSDTKAGWTVGGGIEFALVGNLTAKVEYLHVDLGTLGCTTACGFVGNTNVKFNEEVVRGGLNFRF